MRAPAECARRLWMLADLLEGNAGELALLDTLNQGTSMPLAHLRAAAGPVEVIHYYAGSRTSIAASTSSLSLPDPRPLQAIGPPLHAYTVREPIGMVGAITPWNVLTTNRFRTAASGSRVGGANLAGPGSRNTQK